MQEFPGVFKEAFKMQEFRKVTTYEIVHNYFQADEHLSGAEAMPPGTDEVSQLEPTSRRSQEKIKEEDATDSADDDGQLSRCHSRSVSHDSYFRLLVNNKPLVNASHDDDLPLEDGEQHVDQQQQQESSFFDDVIYAEISKSSIKSITSIKSSYRKCWQNVLYY